LNQDLITYPILTGYLKIPREALREVLEENFQIYKYTTIGTAKPTPEEMAGVKHHLFDFLEPDQDYSAYQYAEAARKLIEEITAKGKLPIVVGGTGLYLKALTEGIFKSPKPDKAYRRELEILAKEKGVPFLHAMLTEIDPEASAKITPNDKIRLIRALETYKTTSRTLSDLQRGGEYIKAGPALWIGLEYPRQVLYERINKRVDKMIEMGLETEVRNLRPYNDAVRTKKMIGYVELMDYLFDRKITRDEAIAKVKQHHRNYAKRQMTWFRRQAEVNWYNPLKGNYLDEIYGLCDRYLKNA